MPASACGAERWPPKLASLPFLFSPTQSSAPSSSQRPRPSRSCSASPASVRARPTSTEHQSARSAAARNHRSDIWPKKCSTKLFSRVLRLVIVTRKPFGLSLFKACSESFLQTLPDLELHQDPALFSSRPKPASSPQGQKSTPHPSSSAIAVRPACCPTATTQNQ